MSWNINNSCTTCYTAMFRMSFGGKIPPFPQVWEILKKCRGPDAWIFLTSLIEGYTIKTSKEKNNCLLHAVLDSAKQWIPEFAHGISVEEMRYALHSDPSLEKVHPEEMLPTDAIWPLARLLALRIILLVAEDHQSEDLVGASYIEYAEPDKNTEYTRHPTTGLPLYVVIALRKQHFCALRQGGLYEVIVQQGCVAN